MKHFFAYLSAIAMLLATVPASAQTLDGSRAGDNYGNALSVQTVQTQFGDNESELNAGFAQASTADGMLRLLLTGNLQNNFNKLNIFIDSVAGGQNQIGPDTGNAGVNPGSNNDGLFSAYSGFKFDTGFDADYVLINRNGNAGGVDRFDFNFLSIGNATVAEESFDIFSGTQEGANLSVGASGIGVAFDNSNLAGVAGGTAAADQNAALLVETGLEIWIPLSAIGNPGLNDQILISAHVNGGGHDFLSNQSLGGFTAPQVNLGNPVPGIDLNSFAGIQHFTVTVVPEPSALALLGLGAFGLITRRRRG